MAHDTVVGLDLDANELIQAADRLGMVAFAFSGVAVGRSRGMDLFGLIVMGVITAVGGGVIRDVLVGRTPYALDNWDYIAWPLIASMLAATIGAWLDRTPTPVLLIANAAGIGAFAVAGAVSAIQADLPMPAVIVLAIITATGGGVIRDLLADRVPVVLTSELNATIAAVAGLAVWTLEPVSLELASAIGFALGVAGRIIAHLVGAQLPGAATPPEAA